jgi:hypothetical protein
MPKLKGALKLLNLYNFLILTYNRNYLFSFLDKYIIFKKFSTLNEYESEIQNDKKMLFKVWQSQYPTEKEKKDFSKFKLKYKKKDHIELKRPTLIFKDCL